jgi:hypothetical protein
MSHISIALNEVLDRMKAESKITREKFALRIGMPLSTLSGYTNERTQVDGDSLGRLISGLEEPDAKRLVSAHLNDQLPEHWRHRVMIDVGEEHVERPQLTGFGDLPVGFRKDVESIIGEAKHNRHVISFMREFSALLFDDKSPAPDVDDILCPGAEKFPQQDVPTGAVHSRSGASTASSKGNSLNEESPAPAPRKGPKTKAVGTRAAPRAMQKREGKKI